MKKYLLPKKGKFYKANLHMHTDKSDGVGSPEEVKAAYQAEGYSVVAFTDHEVLLSHEDLTDDSFVAITSFEKSVSLPSVSGIWEYGKEAHFNLYAKDPNNLSCPVLNPATVWGNARRYVTDEMLAFNYRAEYSAKGFNDMIRKANEAGFLVALNHPVWSTQNYEDYKSIDGLWGIEVYNYFSELTGYSEGDQPLDELLRLGRRVFPTATDDAHKIEHRFGGHVMIKSNKLTYKAIIQALEYGDFYASSGPEITELYLDGKTLVVECSSARSITVNTERRSNLCQNAIGGEGITHAEFDLGGYLNGVSDVERSAYFRVTVTGFDGKKAYTRAYFVDEL